MNVKIRKIRGVPKEDLLNKKCNIYVGISLGNKWFTKEHIKEYILWALEYTKSRVGVIIADKIHAINYEVRNRKSPEKALKRAIKEGDKMKKLVEEIISELPMEKRKIIDIIRWEDLEKDPFIIKFQKFLYNEFEKNSEFKKIILHIVKEATKRGKKKFTEEQNKRLARYVLDELPGMINGFMHKNAYYELYPYPKDTYIAKLVEKIQKKKIFSYFHEKFPIKKAGLVVLELI